MGCCPDTETEVVYDWQLSSAKSFLERVSLLQAQRMPGPRMDPESLRSHNIPLVAPQPNPEGQHHLEGEPVPDRGQTFHWPHLLAEPE